MVYRQYEVVESTIPEIEVGTFWSVRKLKAMVEKLHYVIEINTDAGFIEVYDYNVNKVLLAYRIYS